MINNNNRLSIVVALGALTASKVLSALYAHKKMKVVGASFIQEGAVSASGTNYLALQLKKNNVAVESAVNTQAGLAARSPLHLDLPEGGLVLEQGQVLSLDVAETGTFTESADSILVLDVEVLAS